MRVAFVDDDRLEAKRVFLTLKRKINELNIPLESFELFQTGEEFFENFRPGEYELILLDIFLGNEHGVDLARQIRRNDYHTQIVFCSNSNEFATESYEVNASYYLTKPVSEDSVLRMLQALGYGNDDLETPVVLPDGQQALASQFLYSEYHNHCIIIHFRNMKPIKTWLSQKNFAEIFLKLDNFVAVTPGTIINLNAVRNFEDDCFVMEDGTHVLTSLRRKKELMERYQNFLFEELRRR